MNKIPKAFSLIEISIVFIIIGILVGGIMSGIDLYRDFKEQTVKRLTLSSPVRRIPDLSAWYETTQQDFKIWYDYGIGGRQLDGAWKDMNPQLSLKKNLTGRAYVNDKGIAGFKSIFFFWNHAFLNSELMPQYELVSSEGNTIFMVLECQLASGTCGSPFGISSTQYCQQSDQGKYKIVIEHMWDDFYFHVRGENEQTQSVGGKYSANNWIGKSRITTFQNNPNKMFIKIDGKLFAENNSIDPAKFMIGSTPVRINIGCAGNIEQSGFYRDWRFGNISEVILFSRPLNNKEIEIIEDYLSKKYEIILDK